MRFLSGLLIALGALAATVALAAHVANQTLLDPDRPGTLLAAALESRELDNQVISAIERSTGPLSAQQKQGITAIADDERVRDAAKQVRIDDEGQLDLRPLKDELADQLEAAGQRGAARKLRAVRTDRRVALPPELNDRYTQARDLGEWAFNTAALTALAAFALGFILAPSKRHAARSIGFALIGTVLLAVLGYLLLPRLVGAFGNAYVDAAATAAISLQTDIVAPMIPVLLVALALVLASYVIPSRR